MGESELQILISAVDEASGTIAEVSDSVSGMAESVTTATDAAAGSFEEFGLTVNQVTGEIENALLTQEQSFALAAEVCAQDSAEIQQLMLDEGISAQEAAATIEEANATIAASGEAAATTSAGAYAGLAAIGGIAFLALKNSIGGAVSSAQEWDVTSAQIVQILKDTGSAIPLSQIQAYAQQVQATTLFSQQDVLSSEALIVSHKNLQGSYESLTNVAADLATKMDSTLPNATRMLTNALADPVAGLNQLIRQGNIDFPAAAVTTIQNMAKVGDTAGADAVILKTLQESIGGVATAAAGAPGASLTQLSNQMTALGTVIGNDLIPLLDTIAKDLEPIIQNISAWAAAHPKLTDAIVIGSAALAGLLLLVGLLGVAIITVTPVITVVGVVIAALLSPIGLIGLAVVALVALIVLNWNQLKTDTETIFGGIWTWLTDNWQTILTFLTGGISTLVIYFATHWKQMYDDVMSTIGAAWTWLTTTFTNTKNLVESGLTELGKFWNDAMTGIENTTMNVWNTITNTVKSGVNSVISAINGFINALDSIHINIPAIQIPGTKIGTPALDLGFNIPDIPMLAAGGIVYNPVLAMIGEQGPEAVVPLSSYGGGGGIGGGQPIIVNINGGIFPVDQSTIKQIGDLLAKSITAQLRTRNYAS